MKNEKLNDVNLTPFYQKRRILVIVIYFLSLLLTGAAIYMMNNQQFDANDSNPDFYKWNAFQLAFNNNEIYRIPEFAYFYVSGFYGSLVLALFCLITFIALLFKSKPNLNVSYSYKQIKIAKVRSIILFVFTILVSLYCGVVFPLGRWILIDETFKGVTLNSTLVGSFVAGAGVLFALADYIYTRTLARIYSIQTVQPIELETETTTTSAQKLIPSSIFDELTSDLPNEEVKEETKEPIIDYFEETKLEVNNSLTQTAEEEAEEEKPALTEYLQPMAYVPLSEAEKEVKEEPKVIKKVEPKPKAEPKPKVEPKPKAEQKKVTPAPKKKEEVKKEEPKKIEEPKKEEPKKEEPEIEEESLSLKDILKFASTVVDEPKKDEKPREILTKSVINKTLKKDYPNVEQNKRENYTTTGLPLADTHYVNTPKGKKCFMYVYETTGNPLVLLKIPNSYYRTLKEKGFTINKSQFPKSKLSWSSLVLDAKVEIDDLKKAIDVAMEFVKENS